jgi:prepilin-type N-terminal cleavage/methylation domain-containing protein
MKISHKGFSLIELLVVIAIIALLTAIVTSNFATSRSKSRDAKRVSDLAQIQLALELFFDRCNGYPGVITTSANISSCPAGITLGTFISQIPTPPTALSGDTYTYAVSGSPATDYVLRARLKNNNSSVLSDDVDGTSPINNTDCTDSNPNYYYCVQPK